MSQTRQRESNIVLTGGERYLQEMRDNPNKYLSNDKYSPGPIIQTQQ
jgi:hypothetical protein